MININPKLKQRDINIDASIRPPHETAPAEMALDEVVDLAFRIHCAQLPVDHAWRLALAMERALPWLQTEPRAAIHRIVGAASSHGWTRPRAAGELIQLAKRTRLCLRLPRRRVAEARALSGQTLDIDGHPLTLGEGKIKVLWAAPALLSGSVASARGADEDEFCREIMRSVAAMNIHAPPLVCGLAHAIAHTGAALRARSVLLTRLEPAESIRLQQNGIGNHLKIGCGIFLPHKGVAEARRERG